MTGLRLAIGLLTAVPVRVAQVDRSTAGRAIALAPAVGLVLGAAAAAVGELAASAELGTITAAVLSVATLAAGSRLLHLDGLADTADAIGSGKPPPEALAIMKRSETGPFGVATLLFVILLQVSSLASAYASDYGAASIVIAAVTGRLVLPIACRRGVPAARPDGLGALVAGTVRPAGLAMAGAMVAVVAVGATVLSDVGVWRVFLAIGLAIVGAAALLGFCVRRFGGVTGDVLGALVETATAIALLGLAVGSDAPAVELP